MFLYLQKFTAMYLNGETAYSWFESKSSDKVNGEVAEWLKAALC